MKGFDAKFLDELKNKNDIVDVTSKYVRLEQRGTNFWGRCPFHHEKTASFSVNSLGQFFYCFGCHKSGDVITLIMELESLDFADAVKFLAERVGMKLPEVRYDDDKIKEQKQKKERILSLLTAVAHFYVDNIRKPEAGEYLDYLENRGLTIETIVKFGIGASLNFNTLPEFLKKKGYSYEEMVDSGAVGVKDGRYYDSLGGRLIIPIINQFGQVIAFVGRVLKKTDFGKYVNTKETIAFSKSNTLFNINNLKALKNESGIDGVILVEGHLDVISLYQAGFKNVVASMGTALTKDHARIIKRYTNKVYISYDGDFAGQKASIRGLEILKEEGLDVKVVSIPDGMDPDDVIKKLGADAYKKLLADAKPLIDFKLDILDKTFDINTIDGRRKYISSAVKVIKESPSATEQEDLLKVVRDKTGVTFEALKRELYNTQSVATVPQVQKNVYVDNVGDKTVKAERFILSSYLFNKPYAKEYKIEDIEFSLPIHKQIKEYILDKQSKNEEVKFNNLYEIVSDDKKEVLGIIAGLETEENGFDRAKYFSDCIKTVKIDTISRNVAYLNSLISQESDVSKRKELTLELSKLITEKTKLTH